MILHAHGTRGVVRTEQLMHVLMLHVHCSFAQDRDPLQRQRHGTQQRTLQSERATTFELFARGLQLADDLEQLAEGKRILRPPQPNHSSNVWCKRALYDGNPSVIL
eukprot:1996507-Rhodomonas_salina.1